MRKEFDKYLILDYLLYIIYYYILFNICLKNTPGCISWVALVRVSVQFVEESIYVTDCLIIRSGCLQCPLDSGGPVVSGRLAVLPRHGPPAHLPVHPVGRCVRGFPSGTLGHFFARLTRHPQHLLLAHPVCR